MTRDIRLYFDTSVLGAVFDREDQYRVEITERILETARKKERMIPFISNIVIEEVEKAPLEIRQDLQGIIENTGFEIIFETEECIELVEEYLKQGIIPNKYRDDARHIAVAVVNELDAVISWNYRHMVNIVTKRRVNAVNLRTGYKQIEILSPEEVLFYE